MLPTYLSRALLCAALAAATACSKQGEGERCDANSANLDCESGLVCRTADQLNIVGAGIALCCPVDTVSSTVDACRTNPALPDDPLLPAPVGDAGQQAPLPAPAVDAGDGGI